MTLFDHNAIYSKRHFPSWMLLTFSAGAVNAGALLACQRYVTHVTGTVTRIGLDVGSVGLMLDYLLVLVCFITGAMCSVLLLEGRRRRGRTPLYWAPLTLVGLVLVSVSVAGHIGMFGRFGTTVDLAEDFALLSLLSFAMGLQNAAVASSTGMLVRTTHLTGPATDLGIELGKMLIEGQNTSGTAWRGAMLRVGKIVAFTLGAASMVPMCRQFQYLSFLLPAATVLVVLVRSFLVPRQVPVPEPAREGYAATQPVRITGQ